MEVPEVIEHFFGVYLLYCMNPQYKGRTYIGYTVNPLRRIKQHNAGSKAGGAWRTSKKGPWNMVLIIHGFPNSTSALRFEWAWQHPNASRRLRHVPKKKNAKQTVFDYRIMVLSQMLKVGPWCRLPLTIRWLDYEFSVKHSMAISPPMHMPISYGKVVSRSLKKKSPKKTNTKKKSPKGKEMMQEHTIEPEDPSMMLCSLCTLYVNTEDKVTCVKSDCYLIAHMICLAREFTEDKTLLPLTGDCPACGTNVLWGDLIRKKLGCNLHLKNADPESDDSTDDSDSLSD